MIITLNVSEMCIAMEYYFNQDVLMSKHNIKVENVILKNNGYGGDGFLFEITTNKAEPKVSNEANS